MSRGADPAVLALVAVGMLLPCPGVAMGKAGVRAESFDDRPSPAAPDDTVAETSAPKSSDASRSNDRRGAPQKKRWHWRLMDFTHATLSRGIEGTAKGLDSFFATEEALEEATQSFVKLRYDAEWREARGVEPELELDARLDLPGTEDRLQLLVESGPRSMVESDSDDMDRVPDDDGASDEQDDAVSLAIEGGVAGKRKKVRWKIRPAAGVKLRLEPDVFARVRAVRRQPLGKWTSRSSATLAQSYRKGLTLDASQDFDRRLTRDLTFRARTTYGWSREAEFQGAGHTFTLYQGLNDRNKVAYEVGAFASDVPDWTIQNYVARIRLRSRIYRSWLFLEISPRLQWPRSNDFEQERAVLFRLEAVFGEKALRKSRQGDRP